VSEIDQLKDEIAAKVANSSLGERELEQIVARSTVSVVDIPDELKENLALFLRLVRTVLEEFDPKLREAFDQLLADSITVNARADGDADEGAFKDASAIIETLDVESAVMLARAFAAFSFAFTLSLTFFSCWYFA